MLASLGVLLTFAKLAFPQEIAPPPTTASTVEAVWDGPAPASRIWGGAEYLLWWTRKSPEPVPLVTRSSDDPVIIGKSGTLTSPTSTVVLGGQSIDSQSRDGARFTAGFWLDSCATVGVEASYFFLASTTTTQSVAASGAPGTASLYVPYFDLSGSRTVNGLPGESTGPASGLPFAGPFSSLQGVSTERFTSSFQGAEINGIFRIADLGRVRIDGLAGFRWLQLHEDLSFANRDTAIPGSAFDGLAFASVDDFSVRNDFYGGQIGVRTALDLTSRLSLVATGKVALGDMHGAPPT